MKTVNLEMELKNYTDEVRHMFEQVGLSNKLPTDLTIKLNSRLKSAIGKCKRRGNQYIIEFSTSYFKGYVDKSMHREILNTLAHEFCHALPDGMNHGNQWKRYASIVDRKYNLGIQRLAENDPVIEEMNQKIKETKIQLTCLSCGNKFYITKKHGYFKNPQNYHCKCGGNLTK